MATTRTRELLRAARPTIAAGALKPKELLALQAFDVAIRVGSFKKAAQALNLSPSAVSHRIRNLESSLGAALFVRSHHAVRPTTAGQAVAAATGRAFAELARVGSPSAGTSAHRRLRLKVLSQFASAWLIPRLGNFLQRHPNVDLAIENSHHNVDFDVEPFDAGISVGDGVFDGLVAHHLVDIATTPILAPSLARRLKLRAARDLRRATLIHVTTYPIAWPLWLKQAGEPGLRPARTISVDSFVAGCKPPSGALASPWDWNHLSLTGRGSARYVGLCRRQLLACLSAKRTAQPPASSIQKLASIRACNGVMEVSLFALPELTDSMTARSLSTYAW